MSRRSEGGNKFTFNFSFCFHNEVKKVKLVLNLGNCSVFPTLNSGWERNFGIFRGREGGIENFEKQGKYILGGESNFSGSGKGELIIATQK